MQFLTNRFVVFGILIAFPIMVFAQELQPATETIVVEGVGKTETSAKKAAYKEAVAKVVGVLIDSSTLVKNDKIIEEELLEYSGGFVTKSEMISSMKNDEGLVRVKMKCTVEKAQIKKKLQEFKLIETQFDGESAAAMEMSKSEVQKNAATIIDKCINERKKIYTLALPSKFEALEKTDDGEYLIPVKIQMDNEKLKAWTLNWLPILTKMSLKNGAHISRLQKETPEGSIINHYNSPQSLPYEIDSKNSMIVILPLLINNEGFVKSQWFLIPTPIKAIKSLKLNNFDLNWGKIENASATHAKLSVSLLANDDKPIISLTSSKFNKLRSSYIGPTFPDGPEAMKPTEEEKIPSEQMFCPFTFFRTGIHFLPLAERDTNFHNPGYDESYTLQGNLGYTFKMKISLQDLQKIKKIAGRIDWIQ